MSIANGYKNRKVVSSYMTCNLQKIAAKAVLDILDSYINSSVIALHVSFPGTSSILLYTRTCFNLLVCLLCKSKQKIMLMINDFFETIYYY